MESQFSSQDLSAAVNCEKTSDIDTPESESEAKDSDSTSGRWEPVSRGSKSRR